MTAPSLCIVSLAFACLIGAASSEAAVRSGSVGDDQVAQASELANRGQFENAAEAWKRAAAEYAKAKDADAQAGALLGRAQALRALGHHKLELEVLADAGEAADRAKSRKRQAEVKAARGAANIFSRQADLSE